MDASLTICVDEAPAESDVERLRRGLTEHAGSFVDQPGFRPFGVFLRRPGGELVGGAYGFVNWNWVDLSLLWVDESLRGRGLGSRLLAAFEARARERGCRHAHLETFSYQARAFYERHGYRAFASLPDYPPGHTRVYLRKDLP